MPESSEAANALASLPYTPMADASFEITTAMLRVLGRRFGANFVRDVQREIEEAADRLAVSDDERNRADAPEVRQVAQSRIMAAIIAASPEGGETS